jgi:hypothetical protein
MIGYGLIAALAYVFYYVGENDYAGKGWVLALVSVVFSIAGSASGLGFIGICAANAFLYLLCLGYNLFSKRPPGSGSGW